MSQFQMWSAIVGFVLPPALAIVQQRKWSTELRAFVAFVACLLAGAGTAYFQGAFTGKRFVEAGLMVMIAAMSTYHGFWKPSGIAPTIQDKTDVSKTP